jgi:hypothetical protein
MPGQKGRVLTGARARFSIEESRVGFATNCAGSEEIQYDPVEVLDNIEVDEFVPVAYRVTFTSSQIRIVGETIKSQGFFPTSGTSPDDHLTNILLQGDLVATIEDTKSTPPKLIMTLEQMKVASRNFTINARGIVGKDITYVATRMKDESEVT